MDFEKRNKLMTVSATIQIVQSNKCKKLNQLFEAEPALMDNLFGLNKHLRQPNKKAQRLNGRTE